MEVGKEGKYALMNWDRTTGILLAQVLPLTQNSSKVSVAGLEKSPLTPRGSFLVR